MNPSVNDFYSKIGNIMGHKLTQKEQDEIFVLVKKIQDDEKISLREAFVWVLGIYADMGGV